MEHLIEVAFKGNRREFFRWAFEAPPPVRAAIIVEVERGEDLGHVHATGELAERRRAGTTHGKEQREPLRAALRIASAEEIARAEPLRADEETARRYAVQKARALNLQMKVSDAEWQWDRRRLTLYFTAEERVDFRALVRQLETHFGVRVQMWHIGPRDEAKRLDGVGHCGRQLCSASWLPELLPVKTSLAKEQRLSTITPTQISGACGRLMCCLRYEHEFYVAARKRFPKQGKIVQTLLGDEKVDATDIFRDLVTLRTPAGDTRTIPLSQFRRELAGELVPSEEELRDAEAEAQLDDAEEEAMSGSRRAPVAQLQRAPASPSRESGRSDSRREPRRESSRADSRPATPRVEPSEPRVESSSAERGESRRTGKSEPRQSGSPGGSERPARPDRPDRPDRSERPDRSARPGRPERPQRPERPEPRDARPDTPESRTAQRAPQEARPRPEGRTDARPDAPAQQAAAARHPARGNAARSESPRQQPPRPETPRNIPPPSAAASAGDDELDDELIDTADDAAPTPTGASESEQRRGRRRRGRRGGRRHRGDGHTHGDNGGAPPAPPSNSDS